MGWRMRIEGAAQRPSVRSRWAPVAGLVLAGLLLSGSPAEAVKRRAFVSSIAGTGNLSTWPGATGSTTLERADSICRNLAANAEPNPLPNANTYRAWISTTSTDAYCHVQGLGGKKAGGCVGGVPPGAGPWYFSNGATNWSGSLDELVGDAGVLYRPLHRDENFDEIPTELNDRTYWTGTLRDGTAAANRCGDWALTTGAGQAGDAHATASRWTESHSPDCASTRRLLCVEPGPSDVAPLHWSAGAIVFVSSALGNADLESWPQAGGASGLEGGDAICAQLAGDAGLPDPGSFVAWLSTASVDAGDRITTNGPFKRVDAFTVAGNHADLVDGSVDTSLHVLEDGSYLNESVSVFTGTGGDGVGTGLDCGGWTIGNTGDDATAGLVSFAGMPDWTDNWEPGCSSHNHLYCFSNRITLFWDGFEITGDASRWSNVSP
jgi:hypothetical protein